MTTSATKTVAQPRVPAGWEPFDSGGTFITHIGPFWRKKVEPGFALGLRVEQRHCNRLPFCHGGMLAALCDVLISFCALKESKSTGGGVTVTLTTDFSGTVPLGVWLEGLALPRRVGRQMVFVGCTLYADGREVGYASGIWKVGRPPSIKTEPGVSGEQGFAE